TKDKSIHKARKTRIDKLIHFRIIIPRFFLTFSMLFNNMLKQSSNRSYEHTTYKMIAPSQPNKNKGMLKWRNVGTHVSHIWDTRSEEHTSELQSRFDLVCRLLLEKERCVKHCRFQPFEEQAHTQVKADQTGVPHTLPRA